MKHFVSLLILVLFINCSHDKSDLDITGKWELIEVFNDMGDGTGSWQPVQDFQKIYYTFNFNGVSTFEKKLYNSQGNCDGIYEMEPYYKDRYKINFYCDNGEVHNFFAYFNDDCLIIAGGCIESCSRKFIKIK